VLWKVLEATHLLSATGNYRMRRQEDTPPRLVPISTEPEVSPDDRHDDHDQGSGYRASSRLARGPAAQRQKRGPRTIRDGTGPWRVTHQLASGGTRDVD